MNPATDPMMTPYTLAARCASATGRLLPSPQGMLRSLTLVLALAGMLPQARAVIPQDAKDDPRYDKGYLVVTYYSGVPPVGSETDSTRTTRTNKINEALRDAYNNNLALYFPAGTYQVNDTLRAYTAHQNPSGSTFAVPRTAIAVIGSTLGVPPTIRLVPATGDTRFNSGSTPRPVIAFKNFDSLPALHADGGADDPASGYFAMLRGININCGGKAAAIGLYFNQAQNSSIENVSIDATNAHTGILGLPARGWGVVNIEVIGGQYGIDTNGTNNAGSVLAGVTLTDQTVAAFRHDGFVPVTLVGFKIVFSPPNSNASAITLHPKTTLNSSGINLIDGSIQMNTNPAVAVINNEAEMNFYLRNVYFKTGNADHTSRLIKSSTKNTVTASVTVANPWARIGEYSYCTAATDKVPGFDDTTPPPASASVPLPRRSYVQIHPNAETNGTDNGKETMSTPTIVKTPLNNLVTKHKWDSLPSADDSDAFNVMTQGGITPGKEGDTVVVNSRTLQDIIDRYSAPNPKKKIFLPKGIYRLTGPINLRSNTTLFGAARNLTRIEVAPSWSAQLVNTPAKRVETPIITTDPSGTATTYLGDLTIGVDVSSLSVDWFTALHWRAGGDSMVHMGQPYRLPEGVADPDALAVAVAVDGVAVWRGSTGGRLRGVARLLADVSEFMTLAPGDVLALGAADGAPRARAGQEVAVTIDGLGTLATRLVAEEGTP